MVGCLTPNTREEPPPLVISPQSAFQGDNLPLILTAEGLDLKTCSNEPSMLVFKGADRNAKEVTVHRIDDLLYEQSGSRAFVKIGANAVVGEYEVIYTCNESTTLVGTFRIDEPEQELALTPTPSSVAAGSYNAAIALEVDEDFFTEDTELIFGSEDVVTVTKKWLTDDDSPKMMLEVDVDPSASLGEVVIIAKTDGRVAQGVLEITKGISVNIRVTPSEVERQAAGENVPRKYDLIITGEGIEFIEPDPENDIEGTLVEFPEFPTEDKHLFISEDPTITQDDEQSVMNVSIIVDDLASIGSTPLMVQTGDREAWTHLTVLLPPDSAYLEVVSQTSIPRTGEEVEVIADAINFDLRDFSEIECISEMCDITKWSIRQTQKRITFSIKVDRDYEGNNIEVVLKAGDTEVRTLLDVDDAESVQLVLDDPTEVLRQGEKATIAFIISGATFMGSDFNIQEDVHVEVLSRSGLLVEDWSYGAKRTGEEKVDVEFNVADDAPLGSAYVRITLKEYVFEVPLPIEAKEGSEEITCTPGATLKKRDTVVLEVEGSGFTLPDSVSGYAFDDPGLQIEAVQIHDDGAALLTVNVSPRARTDMAVLYVKGEDGQAATTFRVLDFPQTEVLVADPSQVERESDDNTTILNGKTTTTIVVEGEDVLFEWRVVEVAEDIGVAVTVIKISDNQSLVFDLQMDVDGYGGFTGIVIRNNGRTYLTYIEIISEQDTSLTAQVSPSTVYPGYRPETVTFVLPSEMTIDKSVLGVYTGLESTYAGYPEVDEQDSRKLTFDIDVPFDLLDQENDIPVFVTTAAGAAVGLLEIGEVPTITLGVGDTKEEPIDPGQSKVFEITQGVVPTIVHVSFTEGAGSGTAALISDNKLDLAETQYNNRIWIMNEDPALLAINTDAEDNAVQIQVKSRGKNLTLENEETDSTSWTLSDSPCDTPVLGLGSIDGALDTDVIALGDISCDLVVAVHARSMADRSWETPDLRMKATDEEDNLLAESSDLSLQNPDPMIFVKKDAKGVRVELDGEMGSAGTYLINIRRPHLIREISRGEAPFVELLIGPRDEDLELSLSLIDVDTHQVEQLDLSSDIGEGIVVVSIADQLALLPEGSDFALMLEQGEDVIDAVQIGGVSAYGEGTPINASSSDTYFFRIDDMDTNDNIADFMSGFVATPGY